MNVIIVKIAVNARTAPILWPNNLNAKIDRTGSWKTPCTNTESLYGFRFFLLAQVFRLRENYQPVYFYTAHHR
jgi:hypothetical protein